MGATVKLNIGTGTGTGSGTGTGTDIAWSNQLDSIHIPFHSIAHASAIFIQ